MLFRSIAPATMNDNDDEYEDFAATIDRAAVSVRGSKYLIGPEAYLVRGATPRLEKDYVLWDQYMALLRGAMYYMMKKTGIVRKTIDCLVVGLPVSNFINHKKELKELAAGIHTLPTPYGLKSIYGSTIDVTVE